METYSNVPFSLTLPSVPGHRERWFDLVRQIVRHQRCDGMGLAEIAERMCRPLEQIVGLTETPYARALHQCVWDGVSTGRDAIQRRLREFGLTAHETARTIGNMKSKVADIAAPETARGRYTPMSRREVAASPLLRSLLESGRTAAEIHAAIPAEVRPGFSTVKKAMADVRRASMASPEAHLVASCYM